MESRVLTCFDAAFNAFHYDLVHDSLVLPYIDLFDKFGWWTSQLYMIYLTQVHLYVSASPIDLCVSETFRDHIVPLPCDVPEIYFFF